MYAISSSWTAFVLALVAVVAISCTTTQVQAVPSQSSRPTPALENPATLIPCTNESCTLREAAQQAGIRIGVHLEELDNEVVPIVVSQFDHTSNNGIAMETIQPERGMWDFNKSDRLMKFANDNGLRSHGFHWLWSRPGLDANPEWVTSISDPDELWAVLQEHLATVADRYPMMQRINVVNEPLEVTGGEASQNLYYNVLGSDYVGEAFLRAKALAPNSELFLNANSIAYDPVKAEALLSLAAALVESGAPIDGVGLQMHLFAGEPNWELLEQTMRDLGDLGLTVAITELDAPVEPDLTNRFEVQARWMARVVRLCIEVEACDSVMFWGVHDGATWVDRFLGPGMDPLLYDESLETKPAYDAVMDVLVQARAS